MARVEGYLQARCARSPVIPQPGQIFRQRSAIRTTVSAHAWSSRQKRVSALVGFRRSVLLASSRVGLF